MKTFSNLRFNVIEKTLTPAEKKKREEIAKAIERDTPSMPMAKKMAIATATAKKVAEEQENVAEETIHVGHRNSKGDWIKTSTHSNYRDADKAMKDLEAQGKKGVQHRYDNKGSIDPGAMMTHRSEQGVAEGSAVMTEARKPEKDDQEPHPTHGDIGLTKGDVRDTAYNEGRRHAAGNKRGSNGKGWGPEEKHYNAGFMAGRNEADKSYKKMNRITRTDEQSVVEGSGPKEKQKTAYRDINSPEYRAAVDKKKQQMAKDKAAEPGKKMLAKQGVAEGLVDKVHLKTPKHGLADHAGRNTGVGLRTFAQTPKQNRCPKCNSLFKNHYAVAEAIITQPPKKMDIPAAIRKAQGGNWKTTTQDIEKDKLRNMSSAETLAAGRKKEGMKEDVALDESKMAELHSDIADMMATHIKKYNKIGGSEALMAKVDPVAKKLATMHGIDHAAARRHINSYIDTQIKEEAVDEAGLADLYPAQVITHIIAKGDVPRHTALLKKESGIETKTAPLPKDHSKFSTHVGIVSKGEKEGAAHDSGYANPITPYKMKGLSEVNDYFKRRAKEEGIIAGTKPARKAPKKAAEPMSDYSKRRAKEGSGN